MARYDFSGGEEHPDDLQENGLGGDFQDCIEYYLIGGFEYDAGLGSGQAESGENGDYE